MRNKKYRGWKLILPVFAIAILSFVAIILTTQLWERIFLITGGTILIVGGILLLPLYLEIKDDRIITLIGVHSLNKKYNGGFKKRVFFFDDLTDIYIENNKILWMCLKDGSNVSITIEGFINKQEIISLVYEVRAQIKGYEQAYVNND